MFEQYAILIVLAVITPVTLAIIVIFTAVTAFLGSFGAKTSTRSYETGQTTLLIYRFLAWAFDLIMFTVAFIIIYTLVVFDLSLLSRFSPLFPLISSWMIALFYFACPLSFMLVSALAESKTGRTAGKYLLGLRVTNENGNKPSFKQALIRNFGRAFFTIIDVTGFFFTRSHPQRLTEKVARTRVIEATHDDSHF